MASEKLIVKLSADTAQLDSALTETDNKLDKLGGTTSKSDAKLQKFTSVAKGAAVALTAAAVAAAALITETVQYAKELQIATKRNGENIEKMQAWAFAANTVGVSLEK
ncbi:MAG TPA: hypothetical protein EYN54_11530, partial [Methylococcaceae bacterium]|nr:hypothetical protein [Methylococcaceae bacterium]